MYLCIYFIWKCGVSLSSSQLYWHITCLIPTFTISQPNGIVSTDYKKYMKHKTFLTAQNGIRIITFSSRSKHEESLTRDHQEVSCIHRWYGGMEALMTLSNLSIAASRFLFLRLLSQQSRYLVQYVSINWVRSCPEPVLCPKLS